MILTKSDRTERCDHHNQSATAYSGLERMLCDECGHISIRGVRQGAPGVLFQDRQHFPPLIDTKSR